jgi:hypothetical protein
MIVKQCINNHQFLSNGIFFLFVWYMNRRIGEEVSANLKEPLFFFIVVFEWENKASIKNHSIEIWFHYYYQVYL